MLEIVSRCMSADAYHVAISVSAESSLTLSMSSSAAQLSTAGR